MESDFVFGKRKEQLMSQEPKESNQEKPSTPVSNRPPRREVELFPPIAERNASLPSTSTGGGGRLSTQISMFQPLSFEEALDVVEALRSRQASTISLEKLKKSDANRLVDFVAGASAALDGDFHKMTEQVFVFCPANVKIVNPAKAQATTSGSLSRALASSGSSSASSFALDALFPDMAQEKYGGGFSSQFWGKQ
jgi:FtsZ-interacting cell division protein YlmF